MIHKKPEGYKDLLVYQKSAALQEDTFKFTACFPKTDTLIKLADQMDRSARSGTKNIIEGWKRNTTQEYFDFLGFSIASTEELKDDYADIAKGLYRDLMGVKGVTGEKSETGKPLNPFSPFTPLELENLKFYPLDRSLPPVIQLYLRCKEVLMLLDKLQRSLDTKMDRELTKPSNERARKRILKFEQEEKDLLKQIEKSGLIRLIDGRFISKEEFDRLEAEGKRPQLFGE